MKVISKSFAILFTLSIFMSTQAWAKNEGGWIFLGAGLGHERVSSSIETEAPKSGFHLLGKGMLSYYTKYFVMEGGGGMAYSRISGSTELIDVSLSFISAFLEPSIRFRWGDHFQIGPTAHLLVGGDLSYTEDSTVSQKSLIMAGLHLNYDFNLERHQIFRLGTMMLMDISDADRKIWQFMLDLQYGFRFGGDDRKYPRKVAPEVEEEIEDVAQVAAADLKDSPPPPPTANDSLADENFYAATDAPPPALYSADIPPPTTRQMAPIAEVSSTGKVMVRFPTDRFLFDTAMSHLKSAEARLYVQALGFFLSARNDIWQSVKVTGHTDARGKKSVNQELSAGRARTVYNALAKAGVEKSRMSHKGLGATKPRAKGKTPSAWAQNRRVELEFNGVTQPELFSEQINELDRKYRSGRLQSYRRPSPPPASDYGAVEESLPADYNADEAPYNGAPTVPDNLTSPDGEESAEFEGF